MAAKGEWNVGVVCNLVLIGRRKAIWVKLFRLVPVLCIVMQDVRVYHDAGFGGNVEATQRDNLVCHTCDRWLGWMQAQGFLDDLIKVFQLIEVFAGNKDPTAKYFVNFGSQPDEKRQRQIIRLSESCSFFYYHDNFPRLTSIGALFL